MYNLRNKSILILLTGIVSYLYLFSALLNKKYNIIFIYFTVLFIGYFIVGTKIYLYNILIIIFDILNNKFIIREGKGNYDERFEKGRKKAKDNDKLNKNGNSIKLDNMSEEDSEELTDKMGEKDKENQKKKEATKLDFKDNDSK